MLDKSFFGQVESQANDVKLDGPSKMDDSDQIPRSLEYKSDLFPTRGVLRGPFLTQSSPFMHDPKDRPL